MKFTESVAASAARIVLLVLLASTWSWSQTTSGTISGEVQDAAGALISEARVTITNEETGVRNETLTTSAGTFVTPALPPGRYTVSITKPGFQTFIERGVPVSPTVVRAVNAVLQVGQVTTEVTVEASVAQVQTSTAEVSNYVATQQVELLPLNGRNYQSLSALMPGVVNTQAGRALGTGGFETSNAMSINGMGTAGTYYTLDGIWNMNTGNMTQTTILPNPDSIQEIRTLQNNYSPKYSIMGASVVMIQTRSGTRAFHGALWEYLRNDKLDARNFFSPTVPAQKQNIFGGTLGGPLLIPKVLNKDRTFFFVSAQGVVRNRGAVRRGATPTAEMRSGIFSTPINDPLTGQPFPTNAAGQYVIPQTRLNPNSLALLNAIAELPNNPQGGFLNYLNLNSNTLRQADEQIKIDHNFTDKIRLMGQYFDSRQWSNLPAGDWSGSPFTTNRQFFNTRNKLAELQLTTILSPAMVNQISIGSNIYVVDLGVAGKWKLSDVPDFQSRKPFQGFLSDRLPLVSFAGGWSSIGITRTIPLEHASDLENMLTEDWSWVKGKHFLQAGANLVFSTKRQLAFAASQGEWLFSGRFTGNPIADFLLGDANSFFQHSTARRPYIHGTIFAPYFEDRWKISRRLTLNIGARLQYMPFPNAQEQFLTIFDPAKFDPAKAPIVNSNGTITPTPNYDPLNGLIRNGVDGVPLNFSNSHNWYFMPMFGFAWDVAGNGKTSVRGGYGITHTRVFTGSDCSYTCGTNYPDVLSLTLENPKFPNPIGTGTAPPPGAPVMTSQDRRLQTPRVQTYSLSVERQLGQSWLVSVGGAGNFVRHMGVSWNRNQPMRTGIYDFDPSINTGTFAYQFAPYQGYAAINTAVSNANGNWHGMLMSVRRSYANGLFLTGSYAWSHGLSEARGIGLFGTPGGVQDVYNMRAQYGNSALNVPHVFTLSVIYDVPFMRRSTGLTRALLGGWKYSNLSTIQSGRSLDIGLSVPNSGLATRPNVVAGAALSYPKTIGEWFSRNTFERPAFGFFGNAGTGIIKGPGLINFDMALYKDFAVTEKKVFQFRAEFFNVFNHTNFADVNTAFGSGTFGQITSALDPRIIEFALRFQF